MTYKLKNLCFILTIFYTTNLSSNIISNVVLAEEDLNKDEKSVNNYEKIKELNNNQDPDWLNLIKLNYASRVLNRANTISNNQSTEDDLKFFQEIVNFIHEMSKLYLYRNIVDYKILDSIMPSSEEGYNSLNKEYITTLSGYINRFLDISKQNILKKIGIPTEKHEQFLVELSSFISDGELHSYKDIFNTRYLIDSYNQLLSKKINNLNDSDSLSQLSNNFQKYIGSGALSDKLIRIGELLSNVSIFSNMVNYEQHVIDLERYSYAQPLFIDNIGFLISIIYILSFEVEKSGYKEYFADDLNFLIGLNEKIKSFDGDDIPYSKEEYIRVLDIYNKTKYFVNNDLINERIDKGVYKPVEEFFEVLIDFMHDPSKQKLINKFYKNKEDGIEELLEGMRSFLRQPSYEGRYDNFIDSNLYDISYGLKILGNSIQEFEQNISSMIYAELFNRPLELSKQFLILDNFLASDDINDKKVLTDYFLFRNISLLDLDLVSQKIKVLEPFTTISPDLLQEFKQYILEIGQFFSRQINSIEIIDEYDKIKDEIIAKIDSKVNSYTSAEWIKDSDTLNFFIDQLKQSYLSKLADYIQQNPNYGYKYDLDQLKFHLGYSPSMAISILEEQMTNPYLYINESYFYILIHEILTSNNDSDITARDHFYQSQEDLHSRITQFLNYVEKRSKDIFKQDFKIEAPEYINKFSDLMGNDLETGVKNMYENSLTVKRMLEQEYLNILYINERDALEKEEKNRALLFDLLAIFTEFLGSLGAVEEEVALGSQKNLGRGLKRCKRNDMGCGLPGLGRRAESNRNNQISNRMSQAGRWASQVGRWVIRAGRRINNSIRQTFQPISTSPAPPAYSRTYPNNNLRTGLSPPPTYDSIMRTQYVNSMSEPPPNYDLSQAEYERTRIMSGRQLPHDQIYQLDNLRKINPPPSYNRSMVDSSFPRFRRIHSSFHSPPISGRLGDYWDDGSRARLSPSPPRPIPNMPEGAKHITYPSLN